MYAVVVEYGDRFYSKCCLSLVDCIRFISDVIFKEDNYHPTKIWIDWDDA